MLYVKELVHITEVFLGIKMSLPVEKANENMLVFQCFTGT